MGLGGGKGFLFLLMNLFPCLYFEFSRFNTLFLIFLAGFGSIQQGYVETSNVNIVEEMVNMILAQRAYELNSKAIQSSDEMLRNVNELKR